MLPFDVTGHGPLYHSERLRRILRADIALDDEPRLGETDNDEFLEQCATLLQQYRTALGDIYVLALGYTARPDQTGSPLEQIAWIALHRGLGRPIGDDHYPHRPGISSLDR